MVPTGPSPTVPVQAARKRPFDQKQSLKTGFPLRLPLEILDPVALRGVCGETMEISSKELIFTVSEPVSEPVKVGSKLEVIINWPVRLNDEVPLNLCIFGKITHSEGQHASMTVGEYVFRTRRKQTESALLGDVTSRATLLPDGNYTTLRSRDRPSTLHRDIATNRM